MASELFWWMLYLVIFTIILQNAFAGFKIIINKANNVSSLNFTEATALYGYYTEEHIVVSEDGYILTMFRIPKGKNCDKAVRSPPVLLMHGLLVSSDAWIDSGPEAGLAYLIADECYDVWIGNARGNHYSKEHLKYNPKKDPEYWNFTPNEIGVYDAPAIIDYILNNTESKTLNYIGYSQGGMMFVIMCSERPGYCDKVSQAILLHPATRMNSTKSIMFRMFTKYYDTVQPYISSASDLEALPQGGILQQLTGVLCQNKILADTLCRSIMYLIDSEHPGAVSVPTIQTLSNHFPAGTSVKSMSFYYQRVSTDRFSKYDHGREVNLEVYGAEEPPAYNIKAVNVPVVIIHGENDHLTSPKDVQWLSKQLSNLVELYYVEDSRWNHLDVLYNQHLKEKMFPKIKEYLFKNSE
ncbi:lipase 3 [Papilio machaon]|uniref:lipase 3 n=1 Tax=Papilio machaon TaxID=76193 RepID=UPI001E662DF5|nr:lipase 3 [Papilio machaon]